MSNVPSPAVSLAWINEYKLVRLAAVTVAPETIFVPSKVIVYVEADATLTFRPLIFIFLLAISLLEVARRPVEDILALTDDAVLFLVVKVNVVPELNVQPVATV